MAVVCWCWCWCWCWCGLTMPLHNFYYFHYFHWSGWRARVTLSHVNWPGVTCGVTSCYTCHVSRVAPECDVRRLTGSGGEVWTFPLSARFHALDPPLPCPVTAPAPSSPFTTFNLNKFSLSLCRCRATTAKSVLECHLFLHNQQLTLK